MTNFSSFVINNALGFVNDPECECEQSIYWANLNGNRCFEYNIMYCWSLAETPKQVLAFIRGYHPDYPSAPLRVNLGSVELVTDNNGAPYQFFFNTPFSRRDLAWESFQRRPRLARPSPDKRTIRDGENLENQYVDNVRSFSSRFRFNGKEWDEETGNYYYGARYYDPKVSVWLSVDRLASKYPEWSPYNFTMNNPLNLIDPNGGSVNVASLLKWDEATNTNATTQTVCDLQDITGLSIDINKNGNLTFAKDENGNPIVNDGTSSSEARNMLISATGDEKTVDVTGTNQSSYASVGGNFMRIGSNFIKKSIDGTRGGLDDRTLGFGMTFLHELDHTMLGQGASDNHSPGDTGPVVDRMNKIRGQMGSSWGKRSSYSSMKLNGHSSPQYIPMSENDRTRLNNNMPPYKYILKK